MVKTVVKKVCPFSNWTSTPGSQAYIFSQKLKE